MHERPSDGSFLLNTLGVFNVLQLFIFIINLHLKCKHECSLIFFIFFKNPPSVFLRVRACARVCGKFQLISS